MTKNARLTAPRKAAGETRKKRARREEAEAEGFEHFLRPSSFSRVVDFCRTLELISTENLRPSSFSRVVSSRLALGQDRQEKARENPTQTEYSQSAPLNPYPNNIPTLPETHLFSKMWEGNFNLRFKKYNHEHDNEDNFLLPPSTYSINYCSQ